MFALTMALINLCLITVFSYFIYPLIRKKYLIKFLNYNEFRASSCRQLFSLPESIINYMTKNPSSVKVYQKSIKTCKYFFIKNPVIHFHCLIFDEKDGWKTCANKNRWPNSKYQRLNLDLRKIQSKIWIDFELKISSSSTWILFYSIIPKLYDGNIKSLKLIRQNMFFKDFLFISQNVEAFTLDKSIVFYENGAKVPCEVLIENLSKLKQFCCWWFKFYDYSNTVKELLKIPHFKNLEIFAFCGPSESFDIDTFFKYLKDDTKTNVFIAFSDPLSNEYKNKLQTITDEILDSELPRKYYAPFFYFDDQLRQNELYDSYCKSLTKKH